MRVLLLVALLACLVLSSESRRRPHPRRNRPYDQKRNQPLNQPIRDSCPTVGVPGKFDVYVLAQSWSAEFCYSHQSYVGCQEPTPFMKTNLTMHGLWPQYNTTIDGHQWPQCCTNEALQQSTVDHYLTDLQQFWPNEQAPDGKPLDESLWSHEWSKHGTCTGLKQDDFFALALRLGRSMSTPDIITQSVGKSAQLEDLKSAYNGRAYFLCDGEYLTEVHTCFAVNQAAYRHLDDAIFDQLAEQVECPSNVGTDPSICTDETIKISAFKSNRWW